MGGKRTSRSWGWKLCWMISIFKLVSGERLKAKQMVAMATICHTAQGSTVALNDHDLQTRDRLVLTTDKCQAWTANTVKGWPASYTQASLPTVHTLHSMLQARCQQVNSRQWHWVIQRVVNRARKHHGKTNQAYNCQQIKKAYFGPTWLSSFWAPVRRPLSHLTRGLWCRSHSAYWPVSVVWSGSWKWDNNHTSPPSSSHARPQWWTPHVITMTTQIILPWR